MELKPENIQKTEYLLGLFSTVTGEFEDLKSKICTEISAELNLVDAEIITLPRTPFVDIITKNIPKIRCQIRNNGFTFEDLPHDNINDFIDRSNKIAQIYTANFNTVKITKIGMVIYFNIINIQLEPTELLIQLGFHNFRYLKSTPERLNFHVNFKESENQLNYNINISLEALNSINRINGSFDINNNDIPEGEKSMKLSQMDDIIKYTYNYFNDKNKFMRFINNKN